MHTHIHTYRYTHTHKHTHTQIHTHSHTHTHTYTHTHTLNYSRRFLLLPKLMNTRVSLRHVGVISHTHTHTAATAAYYADDMPLMAKIILGYAVVYFPSF